MSRLLAYSQSTPLVHVAIEWLAYFLGARIYFRQRRADPIDIATLDQWVLLGCAVSGAAIGALALHIAENWSWISRQPPEAWISGKSLLGGLLGGTLGTELGKRLLNLRRSTGDAWVPALAAGIGIGRLGCQLSGTWDMTYGSATGGAWGWNYGDGVPRYPTAMIEIIAVLALYGFVRARRWSRTGQRFNAFILGYCVFRFFIEFLKPPFDTPSSATVTALDTYAGLTAIQWLALAGAAWMAARMRRRTET